jgi:uncharacterized membrane protein
MGSFRRIMDIVGSSVDGVGVFIVAGGALVATVRLLIRRAQSTGNYYSLYRQDVGRAILLGLEFLIAGDCLATKADERKSLPGVASFFVNDEGNAR